MLHDIADDLGLDSVNGLTSFAGDGLVVAFHTGNPSKEKYRMRRTKWALGLAVLAASPGCSMIAGRTSVPAPEYCMPSQTAYILDYVGAGYFALNAGVLAGMDDHALRERGLSPEYRWPAVALSAGLTTLTAYSANKGKAHHESCVERTVVNQQRVLADTYHSNTERSR